MLMAEQRSFAIAEDCGGYVSREQLSRNFPERSRQQATRRKTNSKAFIAAGLFLMGIILFNLLVQSMVIQRDYDIRQLQIKIANLKREIVATRIEMASLESFDRIQAIAENKLGMKVADSSDYQCIAAVPTGKDQSLRTYAGQNAPLDKDNLWNRITSWVGNVGSAMAQNQQ